MPNRKLGRYKAMQKKYGETPSGSPEGSGAMSRIVAVVPMAVATPVNTVRMTWAGSAPTPEAIMSSAPPFPAPAPGAESTSAASAARYPTAWLAAAADG